MLDEQRCRQILREAFPSLDVDDVRHFGQGWDYELWAVNGDLLFRFPLRKACAEPLRKEALLLPELAPTLSTAIPGPELMSEGCPSFPLPFSGYRKIEGVTLPDAALGDAQLATVGRQLGRFPSELHRFPIERAVERGVPSYSADGWRAHYRSFRQECDVEVSPLLSPEERDVVGEFWHRFLESDANFAFTPVLIHGDLGREHMLVDAQTGQLAGVIDFGDVMVGDPALDFVGLGDELRDAALESYDLRVDETFLKRARIYLQIGPFHEVLYGVEIGEQRYIGSGLRGVRERITGPALKA